MCIRDRTHAAFYAGWPKAWAAFRMAKDIWADEESADEKQLHQSSMVFPIGAPNDGFAQYFSGQSYLAPVSTEDVYKRQVGVDVLAVYMGADQHLAAVKVFCQPTRGFVSLPGIDRRAFRKALHLSLIHISPFPLFCVEKVIRVTECQITSH